MVGMKEEYGDKIFICLYQLNSAFLLVCILRHGLPVSICREGGGGREVMGNDGNRIHEKHSKVNRAKCKQLISSHDHMSTVCT